MHNRINHTGATHVPTKANAHDQNGIEGIHTHNHFIKSVTVWLSRWADPIGWALLALVAVFVGRVWA